MRFYCEECNELITAEEQESGELSLCWGCGKANKVPEDPFRTDAEWSGFLIREKLREEGIRVVYEAQQVSTERTVRLSVLREEFHNSPLIIERFLSVSRAVAALHHPNLTEIYKAGEDAAYYYVVSEYVEGNTLDNIITQVGRLFPDRALSIVNEVAKGLSELEQKTGLVYRSLSPSAIFVGSEGTVKVTEPGSLAEYEGEFGSALYPGELTAKEFFAPELFVGRESDVYSLGAILYYALTGQPVYEGKDMPELAQAHRKAEQFVPAQKAVEELPDNVASLLGMMLARDPGSRFKSATRVQEEIQRVQDGETPVLQREVEAEPETEPEAESEGGTEAEEERKTKETLSSGKKSSSEKKSSSGKKSSEESEGRTLSSGKQQRKKEDSKSGSGKKITPSKRSSGRSSSRSSGSAKRRSGKR